MVNSLTGIAKNRGESRTNSNVIKFGIIGKLVSSRLTCEYPPSTALGQKKLCHFEIRENQFLSNNSKTAKDYQNVYETKNIYLIKTHISCYISFFVGTTIKPPYLKVAVFVLKKVKLGFL